jgi:outer membrane protein assembly factor BamB
MKRKIIGVILISTLSLLFFSCAKKEIIKTIKPVFFIEGIADAIHSIAFDSEGFMYVGSLGSDSTSAVRKYGTKEIFRIDPEGNVEVYDTVECQYIPYMTIDSLDNLYVTLQTYNEFQIMKINTKKDKYIYPIKEFGRLKVHFDKSNNIYFSTWNKLYQFNKDESLTLHTEITGLFTEITGQINENLNFNKDLTYVYSYTGNYVKKRRILENGKTGEPEIVINNLIGIKLVLLDNERNYLYILQYDTQDCIILIKPDGTIIKYNLDLSHFSEHYSKYYHMNDMNFGSSYFGKDYLYLVTWDGDILKVELKA